MSRYWMLPILCILYACSEQQRAVEEAPVEVVSKGVKANGKLASAKSIRIGPPNVENTWNFTISFLAPDGKPVRAGMPVVIFDQQKLKNDLQLKANELEQKQKELEKHLVSASEKREDLRLKRAQLEMELDKATRKAEQPQAVLARKEYKKNQLEHELAQIALDSFVDELRHEKAALTTEEEILRAEENELQVKVNQLRDSIKKMTVKAPRDGIVMQLPDRRGNKPTVGEQIWLGRRLIELPNLGTMVVKLEIPERDAGNVKLGQLVNIVLDASPEQVFKGEISDLGRVIRRRSRNRPEMVLDADVQLHDIDEALMRPGMTVSAEILPAEQVASS